MNILKPLCISLICLLGFGCSSSKKAIKPEKRISSEEITLVKAVPGGSRAHIFTINKSGLLTYRVGSFSEDDTELKPNSFVFNDTYNPLDTTLSLNATSSLFKEIDKFKSKEFIDQRGVKDSWEIYLYIDRKRVAFFHERTMNDVPKELIKLTEKIISSITTYKLAGMS